MSFNTNGSISRRDFIKTSSAAAIGAPFVHCASRKEKPNLLFIWTDEQRADTMAVYGNRRIHAPNLNALASESVVFKNAYISQPVCTPSRSTVMTGLWPHNNTCTQNNIPLPETTPCFPELIDDPDYRTGYFGKWHLGDEVFAQHGFEEWKSIEDGYWKYYSETRDKGQKSDYCQYLKSLDYKPNTSRDDFSRSFAAKLPLDHCKPKFLESQAIKFLNRHQNDPFMLYINFLEPHMPFFGPLDYEHHVSDIELPKNFWDPLEENEPLRYRLLREYYRTNGYDNNDLSTEAGWRRLIANYWGLVTQVDLSVGAILDHLENLGLADNTIVVYTSDHGDMMGSHNLLAKTVMYEESVRVPWLMRVPQLGKSQKIIKNRASHIDLVPTLLELMQGKNRSDLPGKSLLPNMRENRNLENDIFIEWNPPTGKPSRMVNNVPESEQLNAHNASIRTVITQNGWKLCLSDKDKNQLFNLDKDPYETINLFDSGQHNDIINDLTDRIVNWQQNTRDTIQII